MLPFNEILTYFFNEYGTYEYSVNLTLTELNDLHKIPNVIKSFNGNMNIHSLVSYIEELSDEVEKESKGKAIDVIDKSTGKIINIIETDFITYNKFRIEVSLSKID